MVAYMASFESQLFYSLDKRLPDLMLTKFDRHFHEFILTRMIKQTGTCVRAIAPMKRKGHSVLRESVCKGKSH